VATIRGTEVPIGKRADRRRATGRLTNREVYRTSSKLPGTVLAGLRDDLAAHRFTGGRGHSAAQSSTPLVIDEVFPGFEHDTGSLALSVLAPTVLLVTSPTLLPRTDAELAGLDELVFVLHAVAASMPVLPDTLVPAVRYGLVHPRQDDRVALTPRGVRVLAIARGEVAAGMD
jgi:hypothetical protein